MAEPLQLFPSLPRAIEDALRASIQRFGVLVPVVKDQHGRILDGHHRDRIARALDVVYDSMTVHVGSEEEAREIALTLNADRRQLTPEQRQEVAVALRKEGHSYPAIAGALGVSHPTIMRDVAQHEATCPSVQVQPAQVVGLDGKSRPATRPAPPERPMTLREALADRPTPEEARAMAQREGRLYLDRTGHWQSGISDEEEQCGLAYHALLKALEVLAAPPGPAVTLVQYTPIYWQDRLLDWLPQIVAYVNAYHTALVQAAKGESHADDIRAEGEAAHSGIVS